MARSVASTAAALHHRRNEAEVRREAFTMALYVAICLLAALAALSEHADATNLDSLKVVWGTTMGLAVAHWFAFRLSARLAASGAVRADDVEVAAAQLAGAAVVALLATVPIALLPASSELDVVRLVLSVFIAGIGYAVGRADGAGKMRSTLYAVGILAVATAVALIKNAWAGH